MKKRRGGHNRLEGARGESPLLVLRIPKKLLRLLHRAAQERHLNRSVLAREILEKALGPEGRQS